MRRLRKDNIQVDLNVNGAERRQSGGRAEAEDDDVEIISDLAVDGDSDNIPDNLSEEYYKMSIDCQVASRL
jgi:hypothetical protein